jgi:hypothetical protein
MARRMDANGFSDTMAGSTGSSPKQMNPAGRRFVFMVAAVSYILALAMYLAGFPGHLAAVWIFGTIGTAFLVLFFFASDALCLFVRYKLTGRY